MENSGNKQFINFKLCVLSSIRVSRTLWLYPEQDRNHPFVWCLYIVSVVTPCESSWLSYQINCHRITMLMFKKPLFYLTITPKNKSSDVGHLDMLLLSEKINVLNKEKKMMLRLLRPAVTFITVNCYNCSTLL